MLHSVMTKKLQLLLLDWLPQKPLFHYATYAATGRNTSWKKLD